MMNATLDVPVTVSTALAANFSSVMSDVVTASGAFAGNYSSLLINATNSSLGNETSDGGGGDDTDGSSFLNSDFGAIALTVLLSATLAVLTIVTVVGNIFVIAAIRMDRNLRSAQNYLIFSLAVADLMVSILVMPLSAVQEVLGEWRLGSLLCEIWTSADVLSCTASILHLLAIALDRYWAVTNIDYIHRRSPKRILIILGFVWGVATVVSLAPVFGWKDPDFDIRIQENQCMVSQDIGYQIFATIATFYGPLVIILLLYWKIYQVARRRIRHKPGKNTVQLTEVKGGKAREDKKVVIKTESNELNAETKASTESNADQSDGRSSADSQLVATNDQATKTTNATITITTTTTDGTTTTTTDGAAASTASVTGRQNTLQPPDMAIISDVREAESGHSGESSVTLPLPGNLATSSTAIAATSAVAITTNGASSTSAASGQARVRSRESMNSKRERKAAKTLAIITGVFVICWLPFFIVALLMPLTGHSLPKLLLSFFLWLGYANSMLNPIIYTIFSPDFRAAFKRILLGRRVHGVKASAARDWKGQQKQQQAAANR